MNIRTVGAVPVSPAWALRMSWFGWVVIGAEVLLLDMLSLKAFAALLASAAVTSLCAASKVNTARIEAALTDHASRMEEITQAHAEVITRHVLTIERFFDMGKRSDEAARRDAADVSARNGHGTGPFQMYKGGLM